MRRPTPLAEQLAWWRNAIETGDHHRSAFSKQAGNITILKLQQAAGKPAGRENVG